LNSYRRSTALVTGGLASGVLNGRSGAELVACLFLMEVSNPSLHLRSLLLEMKLKVGWCKVTAGHRVGPQCSP
jgi:hypothetical protein